MKTTLTAKAVESAKPAATRYQLHDALLPGLVLIVHPTGKKVWAVRFRLHGKAHKHTLGPYPVLPLAKARELGQGALQKVARGIDPATDADDGRLVKNVVADFLERHAKGLRTYDETKRTFDHDVIPKWGERPIREITKQDVVKLIDGLIKRKVPRQANIVFAKVRKLFKWAVGQAILDTSPCADISPKATERGPRARVLTDAEIKAFWIAAGGLGYPFGPAFRVLLVTGQRLGEVAGMRWSELHPLGTERYDWLLPRERTKNQREHAVPLSLLAVDCFALDVPTIEGQDLLFTTTGETAISGFSKAKARLDEAMGVTGWTLHDLRRTVATGLQQCGIAPHITEAILNHKSGIISGVAAVYSRFEYAEEKRKALDLWAKRLQTIISVE